MGLVYYFPGHPSNTISSGALKFYVGFQKFTYEPLEQCDFVESQGSSWRSPYHIQNNVYYLQIEIFKLNPHIDRNIVVPTVFALKKKTHIIYHRFGRVSITRLKQTTRKGLMEGLPENLPEFEDPCPICLLTKATKITRGLTTDVSTPPPYFHASDGFFVFKC